MRASKVVRREHLVLPLAKRLSGQHTFGGDTGTRVGMLEARVMPMRIVQSSGFESRENEQTTRAAKERATVNCELAHGTLGEREDDI
jgi:hypothetical protein